MDKVILSHGPIKVSIEREHDRAALVMETEKQMRFALAYAVLVAIIAGETVQFSHRGIYCKLTREDSQINATYSWNGVPESASCDAYDLEQLLSSLDGV